LCGRHPRLGRRGAGEGAARQLDLGGGRLAFGEYPARAFSFDFRELIAQHGLHARAVARRDAGRPRQRQQHGDQHARRHDRKDKPQEHACQHLLATGRLPQGACRRALAAGRLPQGACRLP